MTTHERRAHDDKLKFSCRKDAKRYARRSHLRGIHAYVCPSCPYWHLGHLPHDVRYGAASGTFEPLPTGSAHTLLHSSADARLMVTQLIDDEGWEDIIGARVAAQIAYIQRTENRNPTLEEAAGFGDEYWTAIGTKPADWKSSEEDWHASVINASMMLLARRDWITLDRRGRDVRIGHQFARSLAA